MKATVKLEIKGVVIELTMDEVRALRDELLRLAPIAWTSPFTLPPPPVFIPLPSSPWPTYASPPITWCGESTVTTGLIPGCAVGIGAWSAQ